ncbi:MAG: ASKHA domain-containing protein [Pseudomonadota bacterium]
MSSQDHRTPGLAHVAPTEIASEDALIVFTPSGRRGRFPKGTPLLNAARALGVDIDSVCGGRGLCGRCQVLCMEGSFPKHRIESTPASLSAFTKTESRFERVKKTKLDGRRLSCQATLLDDVVIDVPADSQVHKQVVRKDAAYIDIELDPIVRLYYVEVQEPDMHDPSGDLRRLKSALEFEWRLEGLTTDASLLQHIQPVLREGNWKVTVAVYRDEKIMAIWPGFRDKAYGLAVDVGSTTIAAHLCDLASGEVVNSAGIMNPQIRFGEDLMSRVSYVMMHEGGDLDMTEAVRDSLNSLIEAICEGTDATPETILSLTFVANPVMHHLLLGINPVELGGAPFALAIDEALNCFARDLDLRVHHNARVYVLPCVAGHVGADTAGVMLSEQPDTFDEVSLLVDVGTNAEIVLGNRQKLLACSSPTGPAFEGAQISGGQRAAPGAIERVRIDKTTLEPRFSIIGVEHWSNEDGFESALNDTGVTGICGSGIIEVVAEMYLSGIINQDGVIDGALSATNPRVFEDGRTHSYLLYDGEVRIVITQNDVRQIQLAKAALYAGVKLLMEHMDIDAVDRIRLAGAFGSHIDVTYAMVLGLIPDCGLNEVRSTGNAAGSGARIALLDRKSRERVEEMVRNVEKIETAVEPRFQEHFVNAMAFPNKVDAFPRLQEAVTLPENKVVEAAGAEGRGRRRRRARRG